MSNYTIVLLSEVSRIMT